MIRQYLRTARHRASVSPGFPNNGSTLPGDDGFIDAGDTVDDLAVSWNEITCLAVDDISSAQF